MEHQIDPAASDPEHPSPKASRKRWIAAVSLIVAGIGGLAAWAVATPGAVSYYATPSEVIADGSRAMGRTLRLGGRVADLDRDGTLVTFGVDDGETVVPVRYRGDVPDTLKDSTDVIAEGRLQADGTLVATRVLAKCSSKFVDEDKPEHLGRS
jgi:cytochrome c-type biogenesis protein CcmE